MVIPMKTPSHSLMRTLTHCMDGGYDAGYYSYMWAEALAVDGYTRFQKEGIDNTKTGHSYRKEILSVGDGLPAEEAYRNYMGRDLDSDALLIQQGILPKK